GSAVETVVGAKDDSRCGVSPVVSSSKAVEGVQYPSGVLVRQLENRAAAGAIPASRRARGASVGRRAVEISCSVNSHARIGAHAILLFTGERMQHFVGLCLRRLGNDKSKHGGSE